MFSSFDKFGALGTNFCVGRTTAAQQYVFNYALNAFINREGTHPVKEEKNKKDNKNKGEEKLCLCSNLLDALGKTKDIQIIK